MTGNKAYLVLGAESSGTRFLTGILIRAGAKGKAGHTQKWDAVYPVDESPIVWRRSVPHAHKWSFVEDMVHGLRLRDYEVFAYVTARDWYAILNSQRGKHTPGIKTALENTQRAYKVIFQALATMKVPYMMFSYEGAVNRGLEYINKALEMGGLEPIDDFQIRQENDKYYKGRDNKE